MPRSLVTPAMLDLARALVAERLPVPVVPPVNDPRVDMDDEAAMQAAYARFEEHRHERNECAREIARQLDCKVALAWRALCKAERERNNRIRESLI